MILFVFMLFYFFLVFFLRSFLLWKRTGINPLIFEKTDDAHGYNGKIFALILMIELLVVSIYAFKAEWYVYLLPIWYLEIDVIAYIGWTLLVISLVLVWLAQSNMADSWRIGIDDKNSGKLVTSGFFAISRNPIFLGIMIANLGVLMVIPNAITLLIVTLSATSISTQIRLEEEFLKEKFGETYFQYADKVPRWL